ncbi:MAG: hypothetical protein KF744_09585 [Taibaiella sp.]|nr:hypothetical protein [Taibaiella sp.]
MNVAIKIFTSLLVAVVLSSANASGQTTDKSNTTSHVKSDTVKPGQVAGETHVKESGAQPPKPTRPAEQPEKEEKRWGLQVVTGEKWYQVSIKLVM